MCFYINIKVKRLWLFFLAENLQLNVRSDNDKDVFRAEEDFYVYFLYAYYTRYLEHICLAW